MCVHDVALAKQTIQNQTGYRQATEGHPDQLE